MPQFEEELIKLVQKYPALYDKSHKHYKDRGVGGVVQSIWDDILLELQHLGFREKCKDVTYLKDQWAKLKDAYFAAMRRRWKKKDMTAESLPSWRLEEEMNWLDKFCYPKGISPYILGTANVTTVDAFSETDSAASAAAASTSALSASTIAVSTSAASPNMVPKSTAVPRPQNSTPFTSPNKPSRKRELSLEVPDLNSMFKLCASPQDDSDNIGQMVTCQHRTLTSDQQAIFLKGIQKSYMAALTYSPAAKAATPDPDVS